MRKLIFLVFIIVGISACHDDASSLVAVRSNLDEYASAKLKWGDSVQIQTEGVYDSVHLGINEMMMKGTDVILERNNSALGKNSLKLKIFKEGKSINREVSITVLAQSPPENLMYEILNTYKHDESMFTQGFYYADGVIYEGSGLNGESRLRSYDLLTGKVVSELELDRRYFGEGIALVGDSIFQLTYKARKVFVYDRNSFSKIGEFDLSFAMEGWGLCFDGTNLIMSNGSHYLYYINPKDFSLIKTLQVADDRVLRDKLNELEYYNGKIYANVWFEKQVVVIDPKSGVIEAVISLDKLPAGNFAKGVANGIAVKNGNLLITGKKWAETFELKIK